jgi:hypothetical protein
MGLGGVLEKIESEIANGQGSGSSTAGSGEAPESSASAAPETTAPEAHVSEEAQALTEIEKLERFKFGGKEWTPAEAKNAWLRQQDYTKKTQSLSEKEKAWEKQVSEYRERAEGYSKYVQNFEIDIENVLRDPRLASEFKKIYPTEFHSILDKRLQGASSNVPRETTGTTQPTRDPYLESRLAQLEGHIKQREQLDQQKVFEADVKANEAMLDSICDRLGKEYNFADQDAVLSRAEQMLSQMKPEQLSAPNFQERWEAEMGKLFRQSHETHLGRYQAHYKEQITKQKQANSRGKDMGQGGATPARAPERLRLKDVKGHILSEMAKNG